MVSVNIYLPKSWQFIILLYIYLTQKEGEKQRETKPKIKIEGDVSLQMCYSFQPCHINIFGKI